MLLEGHPNLRAGFWRTGLREPVQVVPADADPDWREADLTGLPAEARAAALAGLCATERTTPFAMDRPPLVRFVLVRLGAAESRLVITNHHILWDGWSLPVLVGELFALYEAAPLPAPALYRDYLGWLAGRDGAAAAAAWRAALAGPAEPTLVDPEAAGRAPDLPRQARRELPAELTAALAGVARERGATLSTLVRLAWAVVLGQLTGRDDVTFGAVVSGRPAELPGVESMVGLFINTVPVRAEVRAGTTAAAALRALQDQQESLLDHHHLGLGDIQQLVGPGASFDTLVVFENYPTTVGRATVGRFSELTWLRRPLSCCRYFDTALIGPRQKTIWPV